MLWFWLLLVAKDLYEQQTKRGSFMTRPDNVFLWRSLITESMRTIYKQCEMYIHYNVMMLLATDL